MAEAEEQYGRLASEITEVKREFFYPPWFPKNRLSLIVGESDAGKSTFLSTLLTKAKRPVLFPGFEEDVEGDLVPRLRAANVKLDKILIVEEELFLYSEGPKLLRILQQHKADLVAFDPIDSYISGEGVENDNSVVRKALEALKRACDEAGCTPIGIRHPGKSAGNWLRGAAAWRNVPRAIAVLEWLDPSSEERVIWMNKSKSKPRPEPQRFKITGPDGEPGVFQLLGKADPYVCLSEDVAKKRDNRDLLRQARLFLRAELRDGPKTVGALYALGKPLGLSEYMIRQAHKVDHVIEHDPPKTGPGAEYKWEKPAEWPPVT